VFHNPGNKVSLKIGRLPGNDQKVTPEKLKGLDPPICAKIFTNSLSTAAFSDSHCFNYDIQLMSILLSAFGGRVPEPF
jgi:hypothetical protein